MIILSHVSKKYISKKNIETNALNDVHLSLDNKGMTFIVGKTGCGKSTLLNLLGKLDEPTSGEIFIGKKNITQNSKIENDNYRNHFIGFVFQEYNLIDELTVYANIALVSQLQGESIDEQAIDEQLNKFDLSKQKYKLCDELSGGQKQRVAIIRAIMKKPKLILADEPTGALDNQTGTDILQILKELSKDILIVVVSHDMEYANKFGDRVIELSDGKIIKDTGNREYDTLENIEINQKRRKFKIKDGLKLGLFNLKHRVKRLILMLLISIFSFIFLGLLGTFLTFDENKIIVESMEKEKISQIYLTKEEYASNTYDTSVSKSEIEALEEKYNRPFYPVFRDFVDNINSNLATYNHSEDQSNHFYITWLYGEIEIDENIAKDLKLELLAGTYPKKDYEILISDYLFLNFVKYGYSNGSMKKGVDTYQDIIGMSLALNSKSLIITGVINTNFDEKRYEALKIYDEEGTDNVQMTNLSFELRYNLENTLSGCIFHPVGFYEQYFKDIKKNLFRNYSVGGKGSVRVNEEDERAIFSFNNYAVKDYCESEIFFKDGKNHEKLGYTEVVIDWKKLNNYYHNHYTLEDLVNNYVWEYKKREDFEKSEIYLYYHDLYTNDQIQLDEKYLLIDWAIENEALKKYFEEFVYSDLETIYLESSNPNEEKLFNKELHVIGFVNKNPIKSNDSTTIYISDELFEEYITYYDVYEFRGCYSSFKDKSNINFIESLKKETRFIPYNHFVVNVNRASSTLSIVSLILLISGIILAFFSGLLFYTYIRFIIFDKKKQIGVLRSLGASQNNILSIFLMESFVLAFFISIFACIGSFVASVVFNHILIDTLGILLKILSYGLPSILIILVLSFVIAFISTYIPINKTCKLNPVEVLKNSD